PSPDVLAKQLADLGESERLERIHDLIRWLVGQDDLQRQKYRNAIVNEGHIRPGGWQSMWNEAKREHANKPRTSARSVPFALECPDLPAGWAPPDGFELDRSGVWLTRETQAGVQRTRVTYGPLIPVGVFVDPDGNQMLELVWHNHGRWVNRVVAHSVAK